MKLLKSLRLNRSRKSSRAEKVFRGFVRTLGKLCPERRLERTPSARGRA